MKTDFSSDFIGFYFFEKIIIPFKKIKLTEQSQNQGLPFPRVSHQEIKTGRKKHRVISKSRTPFSNGIPSRNKNWKKKTQSNLKIQDSLFQWYPIKKQKLEEKNTEQSQNPGLPFPMVSHQETKTGRKKHRAISKSRTPFSKGIPSRKKNWKKKTRSNLKIQDSLFQGYPIKKKTQSNLKIHNSLFQGSIF